MQILNIGPLELLLILAIALVVLGPDEMLNTARKLARLIHKFVHSPVWKSLVSTSQEIRSLPKKFMAEAGLDETVQELNKMNQQVKDFARTKTLDSGKQTPEISQPVQSLSIPVNQPKPAPQEKIVPPVVETQVEPTKSETPSKAEAEINNPSSEDTGNTDFAQKDG